MSLESLERPGLVGPRNEIAEDVVGLFGVSTHEAIEVVGATKWVSYMVGEGEPWNNSAKECHSSSTTLTPNAKLLKQMEELGYLSGLSRSFTTSV